MNIIWDDIIETYADSYSNKRSTTYAFRKKTTFNNYLEFMKGKLKLSMNANVINSIIYKGR